MMLFRRLSLTSLGLLLALALPAQEISSWGEALEWMEGNRQSPQFGSILLRSILLAPSLGELEDTVEKYLPDVSERERRGRILHATGRVLETANRFSRASHWYGEAVREDPNLVEAMLDHAAVLMELGRTSEAIPLLTKVIGNAPDRATQRSAAVLRTRAYLLEGETDRALRHARSLTGQVNDVQSLYLLYEVAQAASSETLQEWSAETLQEEFSLSPESMLSAPGPEDDAGPPRIVHFPGPTRILGGAGERSSAPPAPAPVQRTEAETKAEEPISTDQPILKGIQTGSFRDPENARYMVRDIGDIGFSAIVSPVETESGTFYRVLIPVEEGAGVADAQSVIVRLKEEGFEGFLVFSTR